MADWFNQLLGGISGAGKGIQQQQDYRFQQHASQQADELQKAKLADINAQAAERQNKAGADARKRQAIATHFQGALAGDPAHQSALLSEVPEMAQYITPRAKDTPPSTIPGTKEWKDAKIAEAQIAAKYGYHAPQQPPADSIQYTTDPSTGQQVVTFVNPRTHQITQTPVQKQTGRGGGGGSSQGAQVPVADMEARYNEIAAAVPGLGKGEWGITPGMQGREALNFGVTRENAEGHPNLWHMGAASIMNTANVGGEDYPRFQALMNSSRALGDDAAKVFKGRQNWQQVAFEIAQSQITPDDYGNPEVIRRKLDRLKHVIALAKLNNPDQSSVGSPSSGTSSPSAAPSPYSPNNPYAPR